MHTPDNNRPDGQRPGQVQYLVRHLGYSVFGIHSDRRVRYLGKMWNRSRQIGYLAALVVVAVILAWSAAEIILPDTLKWIGERLEKTGRHGHEYFAKAKWWEQWESTLRADANEDHWDEPHA